ncbi:thermonuclease family protein [Mycoplasma phocoenae]|uniref:TNase-like domain-containing protein n=1 Tax=Mycoplasma phocoenae TaxID=754517 RepID=A0A858U861_9MOLU|nr:thermonuclease family protein [Mycoplasma phocoenae]QJG66948.1 hypothetical protein HGG69_01255 [Mycoplasma phocoenae]
MNIIKTISFIISLMFLFVCSCSITNNENIQLKTIKIIDVIDGDTIKDVNNTIYRLNGIDTPESRININNTWVKTKGLKHTYAIKAKLFLMNLLKESDYIVTIKTNKKTDKYKRKIVQIFTKNSKNINLLMVQNGLAVVKYISLNNKDMFYTKDEKFYHDLINAEYFAKKNRLGFWRINDLVNEIY